MHGFINIPERPRIGDRHIIAVGERVKAAIINPWSTIEADMPADVRTIIFECTAVDGDNCAIFDVVKVQ